MNKIDRRNDFRVVLDTETCPLDKDLETVIPSNMFVYDYGWAIVNKSGKVFLTRSYVNADVFLGESELMKSSYYAEKIPQYWEDIKNGTRILTSFYNIRKQFLEDLEMYGVTKCFAHNMRFDYGALNNTQRYYTKSKYRYFFPKEMEICDTLKMARQTIGKMPSYRTFCIKNGYLTKNHQLRMTAEILYRFISKDNEFIESHTGLEDVLIEKEIMAYCYKHKQKGVELIEKLFV